MNSKMKRATAARLKLKLNQQAQAILLVAALISPAIVLAVSGCGSEKTKLDSAPANQEVTAAGGASAMVDNQHKIGGAAIVDLRRASKNGATPEFTHAVILPGRGMNTFQLQAYVPGKGIVDVLHSISLDQAEQLFSADDPDGNLSFKYGGAILVPFANRIRGTLDPDKTHMMTQIAGHDQKMVANWKGQKPGAERHAMHGLILNQPVEIKNQRSTAEASAVEGVLNAGNFSGHWPSQMNASFQVSMLENAFLLSVEAKNVGDQPVPVGIGWHPYFAIPSGKRDQARLVIPARERALVNNYDDVFPTGQVEKVHGTKYDFSETKGRALADLFLDDCFIDLKRDKKLPAVAEIIDPAANYGLRIRSLSPEIKAFQVYAPVDQSFVAFEPQFNLGDPFSHVWKKNHVDTGMVTLKPGESVIYKVQLELFVPGK